MGFGAAKHLMIYLLLSISPRSLITTRNGCCKFLDCGYTIRLAQALHHEKCWPALYSTNFLFTYFINTVESSVLTILEKWIRKLYFVIFSKHRQPFSFEWYKILSRSVQLQEPKKLYYWFSTSLLTSFWFIATSEASYDLQLWCLKLLI